MALVPAICDSCGTLFGSPNLIGGTGTVTFVGSKMGPCPNCGGDGSIPDGVYEFAGESVSIAVTWPPQRLQRLVEALKAAREQPDAQQAAERVLADEPELLALANRLLIPRTPSDVFALIAVLLAVLTLAQSCQRDPTIQINPEIVIDTAIQEEEKRRK